MLSWRNALPHAERLVREESICRHICRAPSFLEAHIVALYMPIRGEVDLGPLWCEQDKECVFPRVAGSTLVFSPAGSKDHFTTGSYGIPEPISTVVVDPGAIDLILVPGVAFDRTGCRLGYGKGYYDRLLKANPGLNTIGVCFEECLLDEIITDPWDVRVRYVVTQQGLLESEGEVR